MQHVINKIMETKQITVCDAIFIDVSCEHNDSTDIKCGGPYILGYEFYVSPDENIEEVETKIKGFIKKYNRPFIGINHYVKKNFNVERLWTIDIIEECIKNNAI